MPFHALFLSKPLKVAQNNISHTEDLFGTNRISLFCESYWLFLSLFPFPKSSVEQPSHFPGTRIYMYDLPKTVVRDILKNLMDVKMHRSGNEEAALVGMTESGFSKSA